MVLGLRPRRAEAMSGLTGCLGSLKAAASTPAARSSKTAAGMAATRANGPVMGESSWMRIGSKSGKGVSSLYFSLTSPHSIEPRLSVAATRRPAISRS